MLAIARSGSLAGAGRLLGISHPTIFRQSKALEEALGVQLFERDREGCHLTAAGRDVLAVAEKFEQDVEQLEARVAGRDEKPEGSIRVATVDTLVSGPLPEVLRSFCLQWPGITLDVQVSTSMADILKREADVAIRAGGTPPEQLVGRKLCRIAVAVYTAASGPIVSEESYGDQRWLSPGSRLDHLASADWIRTLGFAKQVVLKADSLLTLANAAAADMGLAVLPCYLAEGDRRLRRIGGPIESLAGDLWFLTHPELRKVARIHAFSTHLHAAFTKLRPLFEGTGNS
ncbi:MAG TPA: LysR family transcriptional regulator [Aliidongia sp.]|uniref:LysR family transcriptional regulator n=1 Tax=Aliidongia sp. TaxID=1914230 RepID=UPI002DDD49A1|nr:LysR family transcriptional regulator [Aliidongia sp.]HEV2678586.1 LysR family transcriptional regulator [Aliidongia sp.]